MGKEKLTQLFIDANIFLEVELGDKRSGECRNFFSRIHGSQLHAITSDFIVYTCLLQLEHNSSVERMRDFMVFLDNMESIEICSPDYRTVYNAFEVMKAYGVDFDDALVVSVMKSRGIAKLVSFDGDFDKVREIKRIEPKDA